MNFAAGGVATPADAALMMELGAEGVFVGSGIFKSGDPEKCAAAIVQAVANWQDSKLLAKPRCERLARGSWKSITACERLARDIRKSITACERLARGSWKSIIACERLARGSWKSITACEPLAPKKFFDKISIAQKSWTELGIMNYELGKLEL